MDKETRFWKDHKISQHQISDYVLYCIEYFSGEPTARHLNSNSSTWFIKLCIRAPAYSLILPALSFIPHEILCCSQIEQFLGHFKHQDLSHFSLFLFPYYSLAWNHQPTCWPGWDSFFRLLLTRCYYYCKKKKKKKEEAFGSDRYVYGVYCGDSSMGIYLSPNSSNSIY